MSRSPALIDTASLERSEENNDVLLIVPADDTANPELSIVIPALNEELTIGQFLDWCQEGLRRAKVRGEIVIIDSSTDATAEIALSRGARVLKTPKRGLGRAYIDAIPFIRGHDYHLMMLAGGLRARGFRERLAYFHHIPFPSADVFETLPWRTELLRALMHYDVIGFQTERYRRNFIDCLRRCLGDVHVGRTVNGHIVRAAGRSAMVENHPVSIDYEAFASDASASSVVAAAESIRERLSGTQIILGVDRLDYTKGIEERLNAFRTLLECHRELRNRVTFIQIVVPSREEIAEYKQLRLRIETLVSKINGEYGSPGWIPIQYFYRSVSRSELLAFYRAAHVALVTPLKDGMNLVAKEFCAARVDCSGVLVLSEFAGAAEELSNGALIVNPHDSEGVAAMLYRAVQMDEAEQTARMMTMRSHIRNNDVFRWFKSFIAYPVSDDRDRQSPLIACVSS